MPYFAKHLESGEILKIRSVGHDLNGNRNNKSEMIVTVEHPKDGVFHCYASELSDPFEGYGVIPCPLAEFRED